MRSLPLISCRLLLIPFRRDSDESWPCFLGRPFRVTSRQGWITGAAVIWLSRFQTDNLNEAVGHIFALAVVPVSPALGRLYFPRCYTRFLRLTQLWSADTHDVRDGKGNSVFGCFQVVLG